MFSVTLSLIVGFPHLLMLITTWRSMQGALCTTWSCHLTMAVFSVVILLQVLNVLVLQIPHRLLNSVRLLDSVWLQCSLETAGSHPGNRGTHWIPCPALPATYILQSVFLTIYFHIYICIYPYISIPICS